MFVGARSSVLVAICVVVAGDMAGVVAPAQAQQFPATVTSVVDGDTVDAQGGRTGVEGAFDRDRHA